ncbi:MAG TPA: sugar ABC transporter ATP-binding protein [Arachnia sp.]|nr:sugar ABC transporter ATP-binding protein [Arachnia sp.]
MTTVKNLVDIKDVSKNYAGVHALQDVSFSIREGEVHALCGENGAGKSTLIKVLTGAIQPTAGEVLFDGEPMTDLTPRKAMDLGIAAVYQEFSLAPFLTVAENIFYGREIHTAGIRNVARMNREAQELCHQMGVDIDVRRAVHSLGVAYQQIVEIVKAVATNAKFIIMDEPTAPLTVGETEVFFGIVEKLRQQNVTILFVSHRLDEVFRLCDRVTVLVDGTFATTQNIADLTERQLISHMVGRELSNEYPHSDHERGEVIFEATGVTSKDVTDVSFQVRAGEIVGLGGLVGAGRTEVARIVFGADPMTSGSMTLRGAPYKPRSTRVALANNLGLIPEDRKAEGVVLQRPIRDNVTYACLPKVSTAKVIQTRRERKVVDAQVESLRIKTPSIMQLAGNLSGGNQQKVVLAKMLATDCEILILDEPTRGIDVGAKQEIYDLMNRLAAAGKAILLISSEMPELIGMSDRILVMREGHIVGELTPDQYSQQTILEMASGLDPLHHDVQPDA